MGGVHELVHVTSSSIWVLGRQTGELGPGGATCAWL